MTLLSLLYRRPGPPHSAREAGSVTPPERGKGSAWNDTPDSQSPLFPVSRSPVSPLGSYPLPIRCIIRYVGVEEKVACSDVREGAPPLPEGLHTWWTITATRQEATKLCDPDDGFL